MSLPVKPRACTTAPRTVVSSSPMSARLSSGLRADQVEIQGLAGQRSGYRAVDGGYIPGDE